MKIDKMRVFNLEGAFRGMRNPMNSWNKSDSWFGLAGGKDYIEKATEIAATYAVDPDDVDLDTLTHQLIIDSSWCCLEGERGQEANFIGNKDMKLAQKLIKAGGEHRKFLRQIFVSMDITAPLYWWKEMDQYRINCTTNSTSTMHKLASTPITLKCFETDDYCNIEFDGGEIESLINYLENLRIEYLETKDINYWKELVRWLPEGWLQTRTWTANYEVLRNIYHQRKNHKLTEWHTFCQMIEELPYGRQLLTYDN